MSHPMPHVDGPLPPPTGGSALSALWRAFAMILVSELGDKTFLIAALLAMRQPRAVVFAGAFASLALMSLLSAQLGCVLPALVPRRWTQACAAVLFLAFGAKMFREARAMEEGAGKIEEEMREAREDIEGDEARHDGTGAVRLTAAGEKTAVVSLEGMEAGKAHGEFCAPAAGAPCFSVQKGLASYAESVRNFCSYLLGPVFVQAFVLTFLGEWGDRSQISTIALAAADNVYVVALGTIVGHSFCTTVAVIGGRYISSTKISVKHITLSASIMFFLFGLVYAYNAFVSPSDLETGATSHPPVLS